MADKKEFVPKTEPYYSDTTVVTLRQCSELYHKIKLFKLNVNNERVQAYMVEGGGLKVNCW